MRPDTNHGYLPNTRVNGWRCQDYPVHGWYCNVYPKDDEEFKTWVNTNCPKTELTWRFNNGSPFYQVYIPTEAEASTFALKWL